MKSRKNSSQPSRGTVHPQRTDNLVQEKAQNVGPEKLGILLCDPHKSDAEMTMLDFYGKVLMGQERVANNRLSLAGFMDRVKSVCQNYGLKEVVVGIERSGRYHGPYRRALRKDWETFLVHGYTTKQLRQPANPGNKTDGNDLAAMHRAMIIGLGLEERELPEPMEEWRLLNRARENHVLRLSMAKNQFQERLEALFPGLGRLTTDLWKTRAVVLLAESYGSPKDIRQTGVSELKEFFKSAECRTTEQQRTRILAWAANASEPDPAAQVNHQILCKELKYIRELQADIFQYERELVEYLVDSPYVLLLSIKGINVVSSTGYGAELDPIEHYMNANRITGRAGIYPSRYQTLDTDLPDGPLVGMRNLRLRDAIMEIAFNLIRNNPYFQAFAKQRSEAGWPFKKIAVTVAHRFTRISYLMVYRRVLFEHPCVDGRDPILKKLFDFAEVHEFTPDRTKELLSRAARQLPRSAHTEEAEALKKCLPKRKSKSNQHIGQILEQVMNNLLVRNSIEEEDRSTKN
jgi:transposase